MASVPISRRDCAPVAGGAEGVEFSDGMHGLIVWALATLLTGLIAVAAIQAVPRLAAPPGASSGTSASVAVENIIACDVVRLCRSEGRPHGVDANISYPRSEAARILLTASSHRGMQADDRAYLVRLVSAITGLAPPDAERRVADVITRANENIARARATVVILGFMVGAAALLGAVAAWFAACAGGRQRDGREALHALWAWGRPISRA